jgi:hypothetical protein
MPGRAQAGGGSRGRLAAGSRAPADMTCVQARVIAVVTRRHDESQPDHAHTVRYEQLEIVLPELTLAPVIEVEQGASRS